jgi:hypothetical protein
VPLTPSAWCVRGRPGKRSRLPYPSTRKTCDSWISIRWHPARRVFPVISRPEFRVPSRGMCGNSPGCVAWLRRRVRDSAGEVPRVH